MITIQEFPSEREAIESFLSDIRKWLETGIDMDIKISVDNGTVIATRYIDSRLASSINKSH